MLCLVIHLRFFHLNKIPSTTLIIHTFKVKNPVKFHRKSSIDRLSSMRSIMSSSMVLTTVFLPSSSHSSCNRFRRSEIALAAVKDFLLSSEFLKNILINIGIVPTVSLACFHDFILVPHVQQEQAYSSDG